MSVIYDILRTKKEKPRRGRERWWPVRNIQIQLDEEERLETVIVDGNTIFEQKKSPNSHAAVLEVRLNNYSGEGYVRLIKSLQTNHNGF